ncbi:helix-turn-helix domain-containing protein [Sinisalibacter aestuarii]|nr:AraC family transcriptional regulator [Sinisalibacter aestuarii]
MPDSVTPQFRAARVDCALQERMIGTQAAFARSRWFAFFLESGHAVAQTQAGEFELTGPALQWGPLDEDTRLRIDAGSAGHYLFLSDRMLDDAIGVVAEAADLRQFARRHMVVTLGRSDPRTTDLETLFERIEAEAARAAFGTEISVSAYIRLLLVALWRGREREGAGARTTVGQGRREINRFRNLVEAHFRARWKARQYAAALGMSYDRLHDLCVRSVGKPPAQLIRERCFHEAEILLRRTTLSAERISAMLGFSSASQFNHFFKAIAQETPGAFRSRIASSQEAPATQAARFSDWP